VSEYLTGWEPELGVAGRKTIALYAGGDTSGRPDALFYRYSGYSVTGNPLEGAYRSADGRSVALNAPLPASLRSLIVPGVSRIRNHYAGGTYLYSAAAYAVVPRAWTTFQSGIITAEGLGNQGDMFRPGTRHVRVLLLLNYGQTMSEETWFDNIRLQQVN
jgi:hypothetical protein